VKFIGSGAFKTVYKIIFNAFDISVLKQYKIETPEKFTSIIATFTFPKSEKLIKLGKKEQKILNNFKYLCDFHGCSKYAKAVPIAHAYIAQPINTKIVYTELFLSKGNEFNINLYEVITAIYPSKIAPNKNILTMLVRLIKILKLLHKHNIYHLDLKLANIIFDPEALQIIDFGISEILDPKTTNPYDYSCTGTYTYKPPNYATAYNIFKHDMWSFGIVLLIFILITNYSAFQASEIAEGLQNNNSTCY
jgi:serine/threonine protein kinase